MTLHHGIQVDHGGQRLHFIDFIFEVPQSCQLLCYFPQFSPAQAELGRQPRRSQHNLVSYHHGHLVVTLHHGIESFHACQIQRWNCPRRPWRPFQRRPTSPRWVWVWVGLTNSVPQSTPTLRSTGHRCSTLAQSHCSVCNSEKPWVNMKIGLYDTFANPQQRHIIWYVLYLVFFP